MSTPQTRPQAAATIDLEDMEKLGTVSLDQIKEIASRHEIDAEWLLTWRKERDAANDATGQEVDDEAFESVFPPPKPTDAMFYGLVGKLAKLASRGKEASPVSVMLNFMVMLSAAFGRDVYYMIGDTLHHCRISGLHIGRSSRGRKGDSRALPARIAAKLAEWDPALVGKTHEGGLSTREGIVSALTDDYQMKKEVVFGNPDKRMLAVEGEFGQVLAQNKREGNTLSAAVRVLFDGLPLKPLIKSDSMGVEKPHVAIIGNITPGELRIATTSNDIGNGFLNRFLMIYAGRERLVHNPKPTDMRMVEAGAIELRSVIEFARGKYPATDNSREMAMTEAADRVYAEAYYGFLNQPDISETVELLLERRPPYVIRLAMLFALTDKTLQIEAKHVEAALAWARYFTESVRFIWADPHQARAKHLVDDNGIRIIEFLRSRPEGASKSEISINVFSRHLAAEELDSALRELMATTPPTIVQRVIPRADGKPGRQKSIYSLSSEENLGGEISEFGEITATTRVPEANLGCEVSNDCEISFPTKGAQDTDLISHGDLSSRPNFAAGGRAIPQFSQMSLISQGGIFPLNLASLYKIVIDRLTKYPAQDWGPLYAHIVQRKAAKAIGFNTELMGRLMDEMEAEGLIVITEKEKTKVINLAPKKAKPKPKPVATRFDDDYEDGLRDSLNAALYSADLNDLDL